MISNRTVHVCTLAACLLAACLLAAAAAAPASAGPTDGTVYGSGLQDDAIPVSIGDLLTDPGRWVDKRIRVEGTIADVCPKMGCWVDIASADGSAAPLRFKVQDGVIVFPVESKGRQIVAEGVFRRIEMDPEQALAYARHEAEERGEAFDLETKDVPTAFYRIDGEAAVVRP